MFMMNSNYSVVVVSWDHWWWTCGGPMGIARDSVWMHNKEPGLLFVYVWCSLLYPQTLTPTSLSWGINTKLGVHTLLPSHPRWLQERAFGWCASSNGGELKSFRSCLCWVTVGLPHCASSERWDGRAPGLYDSRVTVPSEISWVLIY